MACLHKAMSGDVFSKSNVMTHDVGIVVHVLSWFVRSRSAVAIFHRVQSLYCRLVWGAFEAWYLIFRNSAC